MDLIVGGPDPLFPAIDIEPEFTAAGTPFLRSPGVVLIGKPHVNLAGLRIFLEGYGVELEFGEYLDDPTMLPPGATLSKFAGQMCYVACGPGRTWNKDAIRYFNNIFIQNHGSILEHANYTIVVYGDSRSQTHEIVRHRAGWAYSQVSQRYVDGKVLRFVMRPEYNGDPELETMFFDSIDSATAEYQRRVELLLARQTAGSEILTAEKKTERRKRVQQVAREILPNSTEAPIVITANARSWRHFFEMRASEHAETEIRRLAMNIYRVLIQVEPIIFGDYTVIDLPDGTQALHTDHRKV